MGDRVSFELATLAFSMMDADGCGELSRLCIACDHKHVCAHVAHVMASVAWASEKGAVPAVTTTAAMMMKKR